MQRDDGVLSEMAKRRWLILGVFVAELCLLALVSNIPFFPGEAASYHNQVENLKNTLADTTWSQQIGQIFTNNLKVALVDLVPGLGLVVFSISMYNTGRALEAIALAANVPPSLDLISLFLQPSTWIELPAYAVATVEGLFLVYSAIKGRLRREVRILAFNLCLLVCILITAAVFEVTEIQIDGPYSLLTWLPFVVLIVVVRTAWDRATTRPLDAEPPVG